MPDTPYIQSHTWDRGHEDFHSQLPTVESENQKSGTLSFPEFFFGKNTNILGPDKFPILRVNS